MGLVDITLENIEGIQVGSTRVHEFEHGESVPREVNFRNNKGSLVARGIKTNELYNENDGSRIVSYRVIGTYDPESSLAGSL